jgi:catecholate siderophore receptor
LHFVETKEEVKLMKIRTKKSTKKNRKKALANQEKRGPRYWLAMGTMGALMAYSAVGSQTVIPAYAMGNIGNVKGSYVMARAQAPIHQFDIPPGPLDSVLNAFQSVTGLRVQLANDNMGNVNSPGVKGTLNADQALKQLLTGTGLAYSFLDAKTIQLELKGPSDSVDVKGGASTITSSKYTEPLRDIPQTISVIPKSVIEEQGATTLRDVLRNVPGLTVAAGEGGAPAGDNLTLRGFSARNDVFIDNARDLSPQARDPFNLEQVEVVKGPSSAFSGRGSTGGTINLVSKSPNVVPYYGFTLNFGTDETKRATADLNIPLDSIGFGKRTALRLNLLVHESGVAGRDVVENQRWGIAPSIAFGLGTQTRLTLSYFKMKQDNISDYGIPWVTATHNVLREFRDKPAPVPRETFYGFKNRDFEKLDADLATVKFERDFSDNLSLRNQLRYGYSTRDSIATPPRFASNDSTVINREMRSWVTEDEIWDNQTDLRAKFSTGKVEHTLVSGITYTRESNERVNRTAPNSPTTLLNPNPNDIYTGTITTSPFVGDVTGNSLAVYSFDTAKFGQKFELTGGLRYDYFDVDGITTTPAPISRIDRLLSWRAGAVYKPRQNGSIYVGYGTSLNPSLEGLSYSVANTRIDPEKTYTFEVGSKWDLFRERFSVSGAVFRVDKDNARTPGLLPDDPPQVLDGKQRVSGIELAATGSLTREWKILAAYTFLDSEVVKSNTLTELGKELQNTPKNSFNIWTIYQFPWKLNIGGGARFVDRRFGNNTNTRFVDNYWTIDATAAYPINEHLDLRLNLYNLNDAYYFDRLGGGHLIPGASRSANISLGFKF